MPQIMRGHDTKYRKTSWQRSCVVMTQNIEGHKKGSTQNVENYRPISLTCIACKIMESIIRDNLAQYFAVNNLFSDYQYGFIKGRSATL